MKLKNMLNKINNRVHKQDHRSNNLQTQLDLLRSTVEKLWTKNKEIDSYLKGLIEIKGLPSKDVVKATVSANHAVTMATTTESAKQFNQYHVTKEYIDKLNAENKAAYARICKLESEASYKEGSPKENSGSSAAFTTDGTFVSGSKVSVNGHTVKATDKAPVYAKDSANLNDNTNEAVSYSNPNGTVISVAEANKMTIFIQENNRVTSYFLTRNKQETKGDN